MGVRTVIALLLGGSLAGPSAAAATDECLARVEALESSLAALRKEVALLHAKQPSAQQTVTTSRRRADNSIAEPTRVAVEGAVEGSRRMQSSSASYLAVKSHQVHEFPSGHTCPGMSTSGHKTLLPVQNDAPTFEPSPASPSSSVALAHVNKDWSVTEIQRMEAPLKVVHSDDCSTEPALQLQLNTSVANLVIDNDLTVEGINVGATLRTHALGHSVDPTRSVCIQVQTGSTTGSNGFLNIFVVDASGHTMVTWPSSGSTNAGSWDRNEMVVDTCFVGFRSLRIQNGYTDGWRGSVKSSIDGGSTYQSMKCITGTNGQSCSGSSTDTGDIVVDGNGDGTGPDCLCLDGKFCTIVVA